jgi:hypothetical protein
MPVTPIDKNQAPRGYSADDAAQVSRVASMRPAAVVAQAPAPANSSQAVSPDVVNLVGQSKKIEVGEGVYTSLSDPLRRGAEASSLSGDWAVRRPAPEKPEDPPPIPISKVLMDQFAALWAASASAVQVQLQVKNQLEAGPANPGAAQGLSTTALQSMAAASARVNKNEKI